MIKELFKKLGIALTDNQSKLIKFALWFVVAIGLMSLLAMLSVVSPTDNTITKCLTETNHLGFFISRSDTHCEGSTIVEDPLWFLVAQGIIFVVGLLPLLIHTISYFGKLLFNKKFREQEMSHSVNYLETDERERFMTMKATKRSYMVLNFALLVGWLIALITGKISFAFWLIIIQAIGALSFRREINQI